METMDRALLLEEHMTPERQKDGSWSYESDNIEVEIYIEKMGRCRGRNAGPTAYVHIYNASTMAIYCMVAFGSESIEGMRYDWETLLDYASRQHEEFKFAECDDDDDDQDLDAPADVQILSEKFYTTVYDLKQIIELFTLVENDLKALEGEE